MDYEEMVFRQLIGFYKHYCPVWDYMAIDEYCPEFDACTCYSGKEKRHAQGCACQPIEVDLC